jgi:two-component system, NarL family, nitrate/nitrite response regulator NarL
MLNSRPIRVLVVAQDFLTRTGLGAVITGSPDLFLAGQTEKIETLPADVELFGPEIIVWEVSQLTEPTTMFREASVPVIAIVPGIEVVSAAWISSCRGILSRDVTPERLVTTIKAVAQNLTVIEARFRDEIGSVSSYIPQTVIESLSERELQVLQLVAEGLPNKSIAHELGISEHTVKYHLNSIFTKTRTNSRIEAVTLSIRLGLVKL